MVLIWRGFGFLAILAFMLVGLLQAIFETNLGKEYYDSQLWPKIIVSCLVGPSLFFVGRYLNLRSLRQMEEAKRPRGFRYLFRAPHSFIFLPLEFWSAVAILVALTS